jgi:hypothetical protein
MPQTLDLGDRIELVSMDPHFHDISIGLYYEDQADGPTYLIHSYTGLPGGKERLDFIAQAMLVLGGTVSVDANAHLMRFPCGQAHRAAAKRLFLEACKLDPTLPLKAKPLHVFDKKAGCDMTLSSTGDGAYTVSAAEESGNRRVQAISRGMAKLGEMENATDQQVTFPCGQNHDDLIGLLLVRAPNVRAVIREQEQASSRGQLTAPGNQDK